MSDARINIDVNVAAAEQKIRQFVSSASQMAIDTPSSFDMPTDIKATDAKAMAEKMQSSRTSQIRNEYDEIRRSNYHDLSEQRAAYKKGKISSAQLDEQERRYAESQKELNKQEADEVKQVEKEAKDLLKEILEAIKTQQKDEALKSQQDSEEGRSNSYLGRLYAERKNAIKSRDEADSLDETKSQSERIAEINRKIAEAMGASPDGDKKRGGGVAGRFYNLSRDSQRVIEGDGYGVGLSYMGRMGAGGMAAAAGVAALGALFMQGESFEKNASRLFSMRAGGSKDDIFAEMAKNNYSDFGVGNEDLISKRAEYMRTSGKNQSSSGAIDVFGLEKGYGIDNAMGLAQYERQDSRAKSTAENIVRMLNVMESLKDKTISKGDLILANEKVALYTQLVANQVTKTNSFSSSNINGLMAAFQSLGGSGADQRAGGFIGNFLGAMGEGGSPNAMLLKNLWAQKAYPDKANDPSFLSRLIEEGTDPKYLSSSLRGLQSLGGGNKLNNYFNFKEFFPGMNPDQRDRLMGAGDGFMSLLQGKSGESGSFSTGDLKKFMTDNTSATQQLSTVFSNEVQKLGVKFDNVVTGAANKIMSKISGSNQVPGKK